MIEIPIGAGFLSAFYSIYLGLLLIPILDSALLRFLSYCYYRDVFSGKPLRIRTTNILGITNSILNPWHAPPNLFAIFIKLLFLLTVLFLDLKISASLRPSFRSQSYSAAYTANVNIQNSRNRLERNPIFQIGICKQINPDNITYYQLAFNFSEQGLNNEDVGPVLDPDAISDVKTLLCLSPEFVKKPRESLVVIGCSEFGREKGAKCAHEAQISQDASALDFFNHDAASHSVKFSLSASANNYTYSLFDIQSNIVISIFPVYKNADAVEMTCLRTKIGADAMIMSTECHLSVIRNGKTLIERWTYIESSRNLSRKFAGPVFDGEVRFPRPGKDRILWLSSIAPSSNWVSVSDIIIRETSIVLFTKGTAENLTNETIVVEIPFLSLGLLITLTVVSISSVVIVKFTINKTDQRPHFNTIDGLSSIAREEREVLGVSTTKGNTMMLGQVIQNDGTVRLRPLREFKEAVRLPKDAILS